MRGTHDLRFLTLLPYILIVSPTTTLDLTFNITHNFVTTFTFEQLHETFTESPAKMTPRLEKCFTMRGYMNKENSHNLGAIKAGPTRIMVPITHGYIEGSGLRAEITPGGADWILVCALSAEEELLLAAFLPTIT